MPDDKPIPPTQQVAEASETSAVKNKQGTERLVTRLELIARYAEQRADENYRFRTFVKHRLKLTDAELDSMVHETTNAVARQIDCTQCAQCCKTSQVLVDEADIAKVAERLKLPVAEFKQRYVASDRSGEQYFKTAPCPFLIDNRCSVYEDRPKACRDFPYLHELGFRERMLMAIDNTAFCPIVFNTFERLKERLPFRKQGRR